MRENQLLYSINKVKRTNCIFVLLGHRTNVSEGPAAVSNQSHHLAPAPLHRGHTVSAWRVTQLLAII